MLILYSYLRYIFIILFKKINKKFVICDLSAPKPWSEDFTKYVSGRGYNLKPIDEYENIFKQAGFKNVEGKDMTELFDQYSNKELEIFPTSKEDFLKV